MLQIPFFGGPSKHLRKLVKEALEQTPHTPDRLLLQRSQKVLVFEYGEMQKGFARNNIFESEPVATAFTQERFYVWTRRQGPNTFPIASKISGERNGMRRERVRGELYVIPSDHLTNIDKYRENGVRFRRRESRILLPWYDEWHKPQSVEAWTYLGLPEYWKSQVEWDDNFYKGREGATFVPCSIKEDRALTHSNIHYDFSKDDFGEVNSKCYLYMNGSSPREPNSTEQATLP